MENDSISTENLKMINGYTVSYSDKTMYEMVKLTALKFPGNTAYSYFGRRVMYKQFIEDIDSATKSLHAFGIKAGDTVAVILPNVPQLLTALYAINKIGAVAAVIHPLSAEDELVKRICELNCKLVFTSEISLERVASAVCRSGVNTEIILSIVATPTLSDVRLFAHSNITSWRKFLHRGKIAGENICAQRDMDNRAVILYSGGTTGESKGVVLTNLNINAASLQLIKSCGIGNISEEKMLAVLPAFHGFGLSVGIHSPLISGCECVLLPKFSAKKCAHTILKRKVSLLAGVPTLFAALVNCQVLSAKDLSFIKGLYCGGDSLSEELRTHIDRLMSESRSSARIQVGYGATECVGASCLSPKSRYREGSVGVALPDMLFKIVKPSTTQVVSTGREGEICISGPTVMSCYLNNPHETESVLKTHQDGKTWLHTGDLGFVDEEGYIYFKQRIKQMIITSGYNVYPRQIEAVINECEHVLQSCVIGVSDKYKGQTVIAYVALNKNAPDVEIVREQLSALLNKKVARYAVPKQIVFKTNLPMTATGKILYAQLRREAEKLNL